MADGYEVTSTELATHAKAVDQVGSTLDQALSAAQQVTMGVQAYGLICGPLFVPMVLAVSTPGIVTLGLAKQAMGSVSDSIRETARGYEAQEQSHATGFTGLDGEL